MHVQEMLQVLRVYKNSLISIYNTAPCYVFSAVKCIGGVEVRVEKEREARFLMTLQQHALIG